MLVVILVFLLFFLITFFISLYCFLKREFVLNNLYLIIPILSITYWALYWLFYVNFRLGGYFDFEIYYEAGKQIFINPEDLYDNKDYLYMPNFAIVMAITISLFPMFIARNIFYCINYILAIILILEFNKILILMDVKAKTHRFLFLISISNGYLILELFLKNQTKYLVAVVILFILRRELQHFKEEKGKDLKYYIINYGLFVFIIGMAPYLIFFLLIYIFHEIRYDELFKKDNLKLYSIVFLMFLIQNIFFLIYPKLINGYRKAFIYFLQTREMELDHFYLDYLVDNLISLPQAYQSIISLILNFVLYVITITIILNKKLRLEEKFAYYSFSFIILSYYSEKVLIILLPLTLLIFIKFLDQNEKYLNFVKKNIFVLMGLISVSLIYLIHEPGGIYYPLLIRFFFNKILHIGYLIFISILGSSLIILHVKNFFDKKHNLLIENQENTPSLLKIHSLNKSS